VCNPYNKGLIFIRYKEEPSKYCYMYTDKSAKMVTAALNATRKCGNNLKV
jgi:hypothetical protein